MTGIGFMRNFLTAGGIAFFLAEQLAGLFEFFPESPFLDQGIGRPFGIAIHIPLADRIQDTMGYFVGHHSLNRPRCLGQPQAHPELDDRETLRTARRVIFSDNKL